MNKLGLTIITIIVGILLVVVFWQMEKPAVEMQTELLIVPKNNIIANDMNHIVKNIEQIASEQENFEDLIDKRAEATVDLLDSGSIIRITVLAQSSSDAKTLSEQIVFNLLKNISTHYNTKTDINLNLVRQVEGKSNQWSDKLPVIFWGLIGVLLSILIVMIVELFTHKNTHSLKKQQSFSQNMNNEQVRSLIKKQGSAPVYDLQNSIDTSVQSTLFQKRVATEIPTTQNDGVENLSVDKASVTSSSEKEIKIPENVSDNKREIRKSKAENLIKEELQNDKQNKAELNSAIIDDLEIDNLPISDSNLENNSTIGNLQTAQAPVNLPIVDENDSQDSDKNNSSENEDEKIKIDDEPTEEELKERLNKLLQGDL
jgi:hypothetical protein